MTKNKDFMNPTVEKTIGTVAGIAHYVKTEIEDTLGRWNDNYYTKDGFWVIHDGKQHHVYRVSPKGKGWHGEHQRHKEVADRAQAKHAQNTPMKKTPSYKPPYRVDVWEERDRLIITVYDKDDKEVASWVDDDARQMFVDGFFNSRDLEQSVLEYLKNLKVIRGGK